MCQKNIRQNAATHSFPYMHGQEKDEALKISCWPVHEMIVCHDSPFLAVHWSWYFFILLLFMGIWVDAAMLLQDR